MSNRIRELVFGAALALSACATPSPVTPATVINDVQTSVKGLQLALTEITKANPNLIPPSEVARLTSDLTDAQAASASLAANLPATFGADTAQVVIGDINDVLNVLAGAPVNGLIPPPANEIVAAVAVVAPGIEAYVQQYLPKAAASPEVASARATLAAAKPMSLDAARKVLAAAK